MNKKKVSLYKLNTKIMEMFEGAKIISAKREIYIYNGEEDTDSMGHLKLGLDIGRTFVFSCADDSESLSIKEGDFINKSNLEGKGSAFRWVQRDFVTKDFLDHLGKIKETKIEWLVNELGVIQSGCKLEFDANQFLHIWTMDSDNIFYAFNQFPPYYKKQDHKGQEGIVLIE